MPSPVNQYGLLSGQGAWGKCKSDLWGRDRVWCRSCSPPANLFNSALSGFQHTLEWADNPKHLPAFSPSVVVLDEVNGESEWTVHFLLHWHRKIFSFFCNSWKGITPKICRFCVCVIIGKPSFEPFMCLDLHLHLHLDLHYPHPSLSAFDICLPLTKRPARTHWRIGRDSICVSFRVDRFRFGKGHQTSKT